MATMNVSLPDGMKHWVEQQAQTGRYSNAGDYVRDLIIHQLEADNSVFIIRVRHAHEDWLNSS